MTIGECGSHAMVAAEIGGRAGKGGEQALARRLYPQLEPGWLVIADRNFYGFADWQRAAASGADLLWRVKTNLRLPVLDRFGDGSYLSVVTRYGIRPDRGVRYQQILDAARAGDELDPAEAVLVRVIEYQVPNRSTPGTGGGLIRLVTTILDPVEASAVQLAQAYHERWEHENANGQLKTYLRGPGRVLRSKSPDLIRAEIYGYLLTHYAISALICAAATEADIDPDRVKFKRTVRIVRRSIADPASFSPSAAETITTSDQKGDHPPP